MSSSNSWLNASEAARRLGVSIKALRLYEQHGLMNPGRTPAGYRTYRPDDIVRATEIVTLRTLGLSLAQIARVLEGDVESLSAALSTHEAVLDKDIQALLHQLDKLRSIQANLARGRMPSDGE